MQPIHMGSEILNSSAVWPLACNQLYYSPDCWDITFRYLHSQNQQDLCVILPRQQNLNIDDHFLNVCSKHLSKIKLVATMTYLQNLPQNRLQRLAIQRSETIGQITPRDVMKLHDNQDFSQPDIADHEKQCRHAKTHVVWTGDKLVLWSWVEWEYEWEKMKGMKPRTKTTWLWQLSSKMKWKISPL